MSENTPWYRDGLRFECTQCGGCCTGSAGFVWVSDEDIEAIAKHLDKPVGEIRLMHSRPAQGKVSLREHANGDCIYFDPKTHGCQIYLVRPIQCRTWPFWNSNIDSERSWDQTVKDCPGAGQGDFVSREEVQKLAAQTDL